MKRFAILTVMLALASVAYAASRSTEYSNLQSPTTAARPNGSAAVGIPLTVNGETVERVTVTISDYSDGGADDDYGIIYTALAWKFTPQDMNADGGGGWVRLPAFDVTKTYSGADVAFGSITASRGVVQTFPGVGTAGTFPEMGNNARLYYQLTSATNIDGGLGTLTRVTIDGKYGHNGP